MIAELFVVLTMIFIGARVGGIGLGIYGMIGVFVLVYGFGLKPGSAPIDVMMIIVAVITCSSFVTSFWWIRIFSGCRCQIFTKTPLANNLLRSFNLLAFLSCCRNSTYILFVVAHYF